MCIPDPQPSDLEKVLMHCSGCSDLPVQGSVLQTLGIHLCVYAGISLDSLEKLSPLVPQQLAGDG